MARIRKVEEKLPGLFSPADLVVVTPMLRAAILSCINRRIGKELHKITAHYLLELYRRHVKERSSVVLPFGMGTKALLKEDPDLMMEINEIDGSYVRVHLGFLISGEAARMNKFISDIIRDFELERRVEAVGGRMGILVQLGGGELPCLDPRGVTDLHRRRAYCCAREVKQFEAEQWFLDECARRMGK